MPYKFCKLDYLTILEFKYNEKLNGYFCLKVNFYSFMQEKLFIYMISIWNIFKIMKVKYIIGYIIFYVHIYSIEQFNKII